MMKALVVGGTGPTGPFLVNGLIQRGYSVTVLHRGTHEVPEIPPEVEHIHADPHFRETLDAALAGRTFDLVLATYGRLRFVAEALVGKTPRFIGVGGVACYRGYFEADANFPPGLKVPTPETDPLVAAEEEPRFAYMIAMTEEVVMRCHPNASFFRYPYVYGPYQLVPREWCVIRRILDKRPHIILPDGGLTLITRGYAGNLAHAVLLAVDKPEASAGQIYNCGDEEQFTLRQMVEVITGAMNYDWEIVSMPEAVAYPAGPLALHQNSHHRLMDLFKIKTQLGYRDPVPPTEALTKTTHWYVEHQPERDGEIETRLQDPFDYPVEDQLVAVFKDGLKRMEAFSNNAAPLAHAYAHPKEPGKLRDHRDR